MENVVNEVSFPVEGHDYSACAKDGAEGVVVEGYMDVRGVVVGDERRVVGEHVIGGASVCDGQLLPQATGSC